MTRWGHDRSRPMLRRIRSTFRTSCQCDFGDLRCSVRPRSTYPVGPGRIRWARTNSNRFVNPL